MEKKKGVIFTHLFQKKNQGVSLILVQLDAEFDLVELRKLLIQNCRPLVLRVMKYMLNETSLS